MRLCNVAFLLTASCLSLACASAPRVATDRAEGFDLGALETFALVADLESPESEVQFGPSLREAVRGEVVGALVARGLREVAEETADVRVRIGLTRLAADTPPVRIESPSGPEVVSRTTSLRTPAGNVPLTRESAVVPRARVARVEPGRETHRSALVVDFFAGDGDRRVWQGSSTLRSASRELREDRVRDTTRAILDALPAH